MVSGHVARRWGGLTRNAHRNDSRRRDRLGGGARATFHRMEVMRKLTHADWLHLDEWNNMFYGSPYVPARYVARAELIRLRYGAQAGRVYGYG